MSVTRSLAEFVMGLRFAEVPDPVLHEVRRLLVDSVGCGLAGAGTHSGAASVAWARHVGGTPTSTIFGQEELAAAPVAACVNSRMIGALDADEIFPSDRQVSHHGAPTIATALAVGEELACTGLELLTAIAVGYEVGARLSIAMLPSHDPSVKGLRGGWGPGAVFAATLTAARLMDLDPRVAAHAMGIAGLHIDPPPLQWTEIERAPMVKSADGGWYAFTGVHGAIMAAHGMTGYDTILDGENGLWRALGYAGCDFEAMEDGLGTTWHLLNASLKAFPCQYWMHQCLTALKHIRDRHTIEPARIERIQLGTNIRSSSPRFHDPAPAGEIDRSFSLPHAAAMIMLGVPPGPQWMEPELDDDPEVIRLRQLVKVEVDPDSSSFRDHVVDHVIRDLPGRARVEVDGQVMEEAVTLGLGSPWSETTRLGDAALDDKFRSMAAGWSKAPTPPPDAESLLAGLRTIDAVDDIRRITALMRRMPS